MKKVIFFLFFSIQFVILTAQTVSISCNVGGTSCFSVEPCLGSSTYFATINDGNLTTGNGFTRAITWTPTSGTSSNPVGQGTPLFTCTWNNQANSPARTIKVEVRYSKSGTTDVVKTDEKAVTINFIAPISQLDVTGGTTAAPSNGGTISVPCGSQALTFTVPTPSTSPTTGVTFTWSFPAGWVGQSSTTSNTINGTSNAGGGGVVSVSAKRSNGSCVQIYSFNVTRPVVGTPIITAEFPANDNAICPGEYKQFKVSAANATIFTWGPISTGSLYNPNSQITLTQLTAKTTLTATVNNACGVQSPQASKIVYVGVPVIETATVNGQPQAIPNYIMNPALLNMWTNEIGVTYNWQITNGTGSIYYNGQNQVSAYAYPFVRVDGSITNRCGTTSTAFYLYNIGGGYYRMTSSNPTTSVISADVPILDALKKMTLVSDARPGIVRMYNANGSLNADTRRHNNLISFDVGSLPRGRYYLNFFFEGNKTFTELIDLN